MNDPWFRRVCGLVILLLYMGGVKHDNIRYENIRRLLEDNGYVLEEDRTTPERPTYVMTGRRHELVAAVRLVSREARLYAAMRRAFLADVLGGFARRSRLEEGLVDTTLEELAQSGVIRKRECPELFNDVLCERLLHRRARVYALETNVRTLVDLARCCAILLPELRARPGREPGSDSG